MKHVRLVTQSPRQRYPGVTVRGVRYTDPALTSHLGRLVAIEVKGTPDNGWRIAAVYTLTRQLVAVAIETGLDRYLDVVRRLNGRSFVVPPRRTERRAFRAGGAR